ncbi:MAG TPA: polysaccharide deacetylase family protein [Xanthobacteraceae bacterium]|jgi:peptidoglycan/xylan/chitin deacetylase (PgdA/CDA1 family)|nr:polysaccharide deacetylase family protein [Xanthobacteraceae bacterium]
MRLKSVLLGGFFAASLVAASLPSTVHAEDCPGNPEAMGVSRTIAIDPKETPTLGGHQYNSRLPLEPKEFILTFDDGPIKKTTPEVLDFLKKECAKATFFLIGVNAQENPDLVRRIAEEGHTIGTHTRTHAYLSRLPIEKAQQQIDDGFRMAQAALDPIGKKVSPFFRYPGLLDTPQTEAYLREHNIATVGIDVLASDWFHRLQHNPEGILQRAVSRLEERGSGILLLHDVKKVTAGLLPELFKRLKARGFKLVHMVAKDGALPVIPPAPEPTPEEIAAKEKAAKQKTAEHPSVRSKRAAHYRRIARHYRSSPRHHTQHVQRLRSSAYNDFIYER